ncbi:hypothetical protein FRZ44_50520 [Hypericibacter terrae]|uniref:Uncharacterized protein n=1 Tax=Hypericibacter terrae TaxID=2602015 RepID=A0A5J6MRJ1_9PROT|nr:hypothetical protein FRZ44_50520 [Hypericibacter terrae]
MQAERMAAAVRLMAARSPRRTPPRSMIGSSLPPAPGKDCIPPTPVRRSARYGFAAGPSGSKFTLPKPCGNNAPGLDFSAFEGAGVESGAGSPCDRDRSPGPSSGATPDRLETRRRRRVWNLAIFWEHGT